MAAAKKSTGVKHYRPSISGFTHDRPSKSEFWLTRLNLRGIDPFQQSGGSGIRPITCNEIAGALGMGKYKGLAPVVKLLGSERNAKTAASDLSMYKHTLDRHHYSPAWGAVMSMIAGLVIEQDWRVEKRGILTAMSHVVIDDVCNPAKYASKSDRAWSRLLDLQDHKDWKQRWSSRYNTLRYYVQLLDQSAEAHVERQL